MPEGGLPYPGGIGRPKPKKRKVKKPVKKPAKKPKMRQRMKFTKLSVGNGGGGACWVEKTPDQMAEEQRNKGKGEDGARDMERKALDEQDREYFVESELSGIYSRSQYFKILIGGQ